MKKLLLIPALLTASLALAKPYSYEISPMLGYDIAEGNLDLDNNGYLVGGIEAQFNTPDSKISPEFSLLYSQGVDYINGQDTKVIRGAFNGVYTFDATSIIVPFAKLGAGAEHVTNPSLSMDSGFFLDAGAGAKIPFTEHLALKLEAIYMAKLNTNNAGFADSNLLTMVGLTYSFGADEQKVAPQPVAVVAAPVVIDGDDDKDGVANSVDECPNTKAGARVDVGGCFLDSDDDKDGVLNAADKCPTTAANTKVDAEGCKLDGDDDKDGVLNSKDICPNTPLGQAVNEDGCPKSITLHVNFANNSSKIEASSYSVMQKYADFMNKNSAYSTKIIGHTDSRGSAAYNQQLSEKRANAIVDMLVEKGVESSRLSALGEGEANPMADNATAQGRAQNRRIEAELTKH